MTNNQHDNRFVTSAKSVTILRWIAGAFVSIIYPFAFNYYATLNFTHSNYGLYFSISYFPALFGIAITPLATQLKLVLTILYAPILLVALFFQGGLVSCANNLGCL